MYEQFSNYAKFYTNTGYNMWSGSIVGVGATFKATAAGTLDSIGVTLNKVGSPTGNVTVALYALTGTPGSSGLPTGSALATSDAVVASSLAASNDEHVIFTFSSTNRYSLVSGTSYCIAVLYSGGDGSDYVFAGCANKAPAGGTTQNGMINNGSWIADPNAIMLGINVYAVTGSAPTLRTVISDTFSSSFDSNTFEKYGYTAGVSVSSGSLVLESSSTLSQTTGVDPNQYNGGSGAPQYSMYPSSWVLAETKVTPLAQSASTDHYQCGIGIEDFSGNNWVQFTVYTSSGTGGSTIYSLVTSANTSSNSVAYTTVTVGTALWLRISTNNVGVPTLQYSTDGSTWVTVFLREWFQFPTNVSLSPYMYHQPYTLLGTQQNADFDYLTWETSDAVQSRVQGVSSVSGLHTLQF